MEQRRLEGLPPRTATYARGILVSRTRRCCVHAGRTAPAAHLNHADRILHVAQDKLFGCGEELVHKVGAVGLACLLGRLWQTRTAFVPAWEA